MKAAWKSDIGKVRSRNEDFVQADNVMGIFLLADGMGGHPGGDIASSLAVRTAYTHLAERIGETGAGEMKHLLTDATAAAHEAVSRRGAEDPCLAGMGTTLDIVYLRDGSAWICHVGDSRVYLHRREKLIQVTTDDNFASALAQKGVLPENIPASARHLLTQAVGISAKMAPVTRHLMLERGDLLLICSDGLTGMLPDETIARIVTGCRDDLRATADQLVAEANDQGGSDNISVILVAPQF